MQAAPKNGDESCWRPTSRKPGSRGGTTFAPGATCSLQERCQCAAATCYCNFCQRVFGSARREPHLRTLQARRSRRPADTKHCAALAKGIRNQKIAAAKPGVGVGGGGVVCRSASLAVEGARRSRPVEGQLLQKAQISTARN